MKKLYTKLLIITVLVLGLNNSAKAQYWMTGDAVNDTIKYLTLVAWTFDTTLDNTCYEMGMPDHWFFMQPCEDPGIDYGMVVEEITNTGEIELTPTGDIAEGDTIWLTDEDIERQIYFSEMGGHVKLRFFAIGTATLADTEVYCLPGDDLWFTNLLLCNEGLWTTPSCTILPNPLGVQDLKIEDAELSYPNSQNGYILSAESDERISMIAMFDIQGRQIAKSNSNSIDCNYLDNGIYLVTVVFESGKVLGEKISLTK